MCNLHHLTPRDDIAHYFRAHIRAELFDVAVGPFGTGGFLRPAAGGDGSGRGLEYVQGQWGMIEPRAVSRRPASRAILTNNARIETIATRKTYREAWGKGRRCLIPATWYQEPNWETGRNIWWRLRHALGHPWAIAGLWSEWTDPATGEIVPNYTMITVNCDGHALLGRLHKSDPALPPDAQDKRAVVWIRPADWATWLHGSEAEARALLVPAPAEAFDPGDAQRTDALLRAAAAGAGGDVNPAAAAPPPGRATRPGGR